MSKEYKKAFKLLKKLHKHEPSVDEVLRYISVKQNGKK